jgi:hypothetical protein
VKKTDREELSRVIRLRAKVTRADVDRRKLDLMAELEQQLSQRFKMDADLWKDVTAKAEAAVAEADAQIAGIRRERGVPEEFRPKLTLNWWSRGENALASRRAELRKVGLARIEAAAAAGKLAVEAKEADLLTALIADGLETDDARKWLETIPGAKELLPASVIGELSLSPLAVKAAERLVERTADA